MNNNLTFKLKKIAFNNSCNSNFVSIAFDSNTQISGKNGSGKSSKLNGVQLGFLPQTTFKGSKKHFYFKSSQGNFYSDQDCYDFYFPHNNSYIVYEYKNPKGTFCQILMKGKTELSIERAFVPVSFDDIYNWFWTFPDNDELGFPTNIQRAELIENIKSIKNHKIVKTLKESKDVLYNNDFNDDSSRYSIANVEPDKMENVIDIFKLTSNASEIDDDMLKKTIVSLINTSYKDNCRDQLNYDPVHIMNEFKRLENEKNIINKKKNLEPTYLKLSSFFDSVLLSSTESKSLFQFCMEFNHSKVEESKIKLIEANKEKTAADEKLSVTEKNGLKIRNDISESNGALKVKKQSVAHFEVKLKEYNDIFEPEHESELNIWINDPERAITELDDTIHTTSKKIKKYNNFDKVKEELLNDKKELKKINEKLTTATTQMANSGNLLFSTNKIENAHILNGLNESFSALTDELTEQEVKEFNSFTRLFTISEGQILLNGVSFGKSKSFRFSKEKTIKKIENYKTDKAFIEKRIRENEKIINSEDLKELDRLKKQLKDSKNERKIISNGKDNAKELKQSKEELQKENEKNNTLKAKREEHLEVHKKCKKISSEKANYVKELSAIIAKSQQFLNKIESLKKEHNFTYIKNESLVFDKTEVTDFDILRIESLFNDIKKDRLSIIKSLDEFVNEGLLQDDNGILRESNVSINNLKNDFFNKIKEIYLSLDNNEESLEKAFEQHANTTLEISKGLNDQIKHLKYFESKMNESIKALKLSSIDEVKINIELEPRIKNFIETIDKAELLSDNASSVLDKGLANKIQNFIEDMGLQNKKTMTINTDSMIKSVTFKYNIEGEWTSKDGSTGTSMVASVMLLSIFIKRICGEHITLSIPVNLDETGNIDYGNMKTLHDFLKEQELVLFSASPEPQISSGDFFDVLVNFDDSFIYDKERLMDDKHRSTYHYMMNSIINESDSGIIVINHEV